MASPIWSTQQSQATRPPACLEVGLHVWGIIKNAEKDLLLTASVCCPTRLGIAIGQPKGGFRAACVLYHAYYRFCCIMFSVVAQPFFNTPDNLPVHAAR